MLPTHNRYDYSPITERRDYDWPGGKRLAFCLTTNIAWHAYGKGRGHDNAKHGEPQTQRNYSWRDYGNRIGVWRLFDLADELAIPLAHNTNSILYEYTPQIFERIRKRGDEIIAHGRTNSENFNDIRWEPDEARFIREVTETFTRHEGKAPKGWLSGGAYENPWTPDLLKEAGYTYFCDWPCDDQPIWMRTRSGPLLCVPYPVELNDSPQIIHRQHTGPRVLRHAGRPVRGDGRAKREASAGVQHLDTHAHVRLSVPSAPAAPGAQALLLEQVHRSRLEMPAGGYRRLLSYARARHRSGLVA